jgi:hypothetical protein
MSKEELEKALEKARSEADDAEIAFKVGIPGKPKSMRKAVAAFLDVSPISLDDVLEELRKR